jgi:chromosomal replication initiator protein
MDEIRENRMSRIWENALATLETRIKPTNYDLWFRPIVCTGVTNDQITLRAPNAFLRTHFSLNYLDVVLDEIESQTRQRFNVTFEADDPTPANTTPAAPAPQPQEPPRPAPAARLVEEVPADATDPGDLLPRYTFDCFVVGPMNQLAHAAARAVAEHPATKWNPLFIYGGVGLGKTHLLMAIGHELRRHHPDWKVTYIQAETFINDYIAALGSRSAGAVEDFRRKYRDCDVLLIDDIQFLAGKERTQDEFFHTFNALYQAPKQIVLTSDKMPQEIGDLPERLASRFSSGLVADIQRPDLETRTAILRRKAEADRLDLPPDVALFLAQRVKSSVRDLEGALLRVNAVASLRHAPLTIDLVTEALGEMIGPARSALTMELIVKQVADYFQTKVADLKGPRRHQSIAWPRQVAMYLCYRLLQNQSPRVSYPAVADYFGGRDHTTVLSACRKVERLRDSDPAVLSVLDAIERRLSQ